MSSEQEPGNEQVGQSPAAGTSYAEQPPGGGSSRGPEFGTGGQPQVPVPPYDDLRGEPGENSAPAAYDASNAPTAGPEPVVTQEEREGVTGTEVEPEPALGVGTSTRRSAEDQAPDRDDVDTTSGTGRPVGQVEGHNDDEGPIDPESPSLQSP